MIKGKNSFWKGAALCGIAGVIAAVLIFHETAIVNWLCTIGVCSVLAYSGVELYKEWSE